MSQEWFNWLNLLFIPGILIGFTVHELGHALIAYFLGDYAQAENGKITANPVKHMSWLGSILFLLFGIGWPKPITFNAKNFKNRYLDSYLVALAGPFANLATCLVVFGSTLLIMWVLRLNQQIDQSQFSEIIFFGQGNHKGSTTETGTLMNATVWVVAFSNRVWVANFIMGVVSLIPLPPFDGFTIILSLIGLFREKRIQDLTGGSETDESETAPQANEPAAQPAAIGTIQKPVEEEEGRVNKKQSMAEIHFKIGTDYHAAQKFDDAIARYRQSIAVDSTFGPAYVNMGLAYKARDQRNEAIHAFRAATRYAVDERTKTQAWAELQQLSALPGTQSKAVNDRDKPGAKPWTDTKPAPDWLAFGISIGVLVLLFFCIFGTLLLSWIN